MIVTGVMLYLVGTGKVNPEPLFTLVLFATAFVADIVIASRIGGHSVSIGDE